MAETFDARELSEKIEIIKNEMFPVGMTMDDEDIDMRESLKRTCVENDDEKKTKNPRNSES